MVGKIVLLLSCIALSLAIPGIVAASDLSTDPSAIPPLSEFKIMEGSVEPLSIESGTPSAEWLVDNSDGTYTYYQLVNNDSTPIHYYGPWDGIGFDHYNWYNEDYGWNHTFEYICSDGTEVIAANLSIYAFDVDSNGTIGEIDNIIVDGQIVGHLIGSDSNWTTTSFSIDPQYLNDQHLSVFMDIDSTTSFENWAVTVNQSVLAVTYKCNASINIEKSTNGEDADVAPGPRIPELDPVTWTYNVTNDGNINLTNITVTDDIIGPVGSIPLLSPGDFVMFTIPGTAEVGQYENNATVVGTPPIGSDIMDYDLSHYLGYDSTDIPTANPLLTVGLIGITVVLFLRRKHE